MATKAYGVYFRENYYFMMGWKMSTKVKRVGDWMGGVWVAVLVVFVQLFIIPMGIHTTN